MGKWQGGAAGMLMLALAGCSTMGPPPQPAMPPAALPPPPPPPPTPPPARTTNAVWALRSGLNVAALMCRNHVLATNYNRMLRTHRSLFAAAQAEEEALYQARYGAAWQARHDAAMTSLYNRLANRTDRAGFCRTASLIAADMITMPSPEVDRRAAEAFRALAPNLASLTD